jgi:hypothetical protein
MDCPKNKSRKNPFYKMSKVEVNHIQLILQYTTSVQTCSIEICIFLSACIMRF